MKIRSVEVRQVRLPIVPEIVSAAGSVDHIGCILVVVRSGDGVQGENVMFTLNDRFSTPLAQLVRELGETLVGRQVDDLTATWDGLQRTLAFFGVKGFSTMAIGALDGALWDLRGKEAGRSISALIGRRHEAVQVYDSGGLWLHNTEAELADYAQASLRKGFRAMKLRLGARTPQDDVRRIVALANAAGGRALLMADANQCYAEPTAIAVGLALQAEGYTWYEEPSSQLDLHAARRIREALAIPIATGENCYSRFDAEAVAASGSAQIFMPDLQRIGGVTEFLRSMAVAEAAGMAVSSHLFPEYSLQLLGCAPGRPVLEHVSWFSDLFLQQIHIHDGQAPVPDGPGWGFELDWSVIEKLR